MSMIAWQMVEPGKPFKRVELPLPQPGIDEVRVRVFGCGVCHTDLGFFFDGVRTRSNLPLTLGHEISGIVEAAGAHAGQWVEKAVIVPAVMPCGTCDVCTRGLGNICPVQKMPGNDIPGGFATHIVVPSGSLCEVPVDARHRPAGKADVSLSELSVIADALTTPYQAVVESGLSDRDTAIFVGVGGVGGFGAQIAKTFGAAVVAVDIDQNKLDTLAPYVDATFNAKTLGFKELRKAVSDFVTRQGRRKTEWKIFETSGTAAGQKTAFGLMTYGGYLAVVGFTMDTVDVRLSNLMAFHATARGTWGCLPGYYPDVLNLVLSDRVKIRPFVKCFPLSQIDAVFEAVHARRMLERAIMVP